MADDDIKIKSNLEKEIKNLKIEAGLNKDAYFQLEKTSKELAESEAKWHHLFEVLPVGVSILNEKREIIETNERLSEILGISTADIMKGTYQNRKYIHSDGSPMLPEEFPSNMAVLEQRIVRNKEIGIIKEDGSLLWTDVTAAPLSLIRGGCVVITTDITERKENEKKIEESTKKFKNIFDYSTVGVSLVCPKGKWLEVNNALCKITGFSREEMLKNEFNDITYEEDKELSIETSKKILSGEIDHGIIEKRYIHKDGHIVWVNLSIALVRDKNTNEPLYFVVHTEDITARKNAEEQLVVKIKELETMNTFMVDRELRIIELKTQIKELKEKIGEK